MPTVKDPPPLTDRQRDIYEFIRDTITAHGYPPAVRQIGAHFGIRSPNGVVCHLKALERKGLIVRDFGLSRAIRLTGPTRLSALLSKVREVRDDLAASRRKRSYQKRQDALKLAVADLSEAIEKCGGGVPA